MGTRLNRLAKAVLTCFGAKIRKNRYIPLNTPVLLYIKVGLKGVYSTQTCFHDVKGCCTSDRGAKSH